MFPNRSPCEGGHVESLAYGVSHEIETLARSRARAACRAGGEDNGRDHHSRHRPGKTHGRRRHRGRNHSFSFVIEVAKGVDPKVERIRRRVVLIFAVRDVPEPLSV